MIKVITLLMLLAAGNAFAGGTEPSPFNEHNVKPVVYTECKAGYLFVVAASVHGISMMQVFKDAGDMVPKPVDCPAKLIDANEDE